MPSHSLHDLYAALGAGPEAIRRRRLSRLRRRPVLVALLAIATFIAGVGLDATVFHLGDHGHSTSVVIGQKVIREVPPRTVPRPQPQTPNPALSWSNPLAVDPGSALRSVSCASESFCVAVDGNGEAVLYAGGQWAPPQRIDGDVQLNSVSCTGASWCMAVDQAGDALVYDGARWAQPQRVDPAVFPELTSVSCATPSFCAAVDGRGNGLTYNGSRWSAPEQVDPPGWSPAPVSRDVPSVSCPAVGTCVGVDPENYAFFYEGGTWQPAQAINPSLGTNTIKSPNSVSCASQTFCVATDNLGAIEAYDGTQWSVPVAVDPSNYIPTISCPTSSFCAGVDSLLPAGFNNGSAGASGQVVTYNGVSWSAPRQIDEAGLVSSISCPTAQFCVAVDVSGNAVIGAGPSAGRAP